MVRIAGMTFDTDIEINGETVEATIPNEYDLSDEQVETLKNAKKLERLDMNYGKEVGVLASYNLVDWRKVEKERYGMRFGWQTYRTTDVDQLKQDNEDLTQALLELAEIVGGDNG